MNELEELEEDSAGTVFRDVILLALIGFVAMVVMLLPHLRKSEVEAQDHKAPGNVIVELHWPTEQAVDVDLWVMGPGSTPVGFWNLGNRVFNLLRDDLGAEGDAYSRGIPAGEYIVNVHMYGPVPPGMTVLARVVVSVRKKFEQTKQILKTQVKLKRRHQEETAFRFRLTSDGDLVKNSVTTLRRRLITEPM